MPSKNQLTVRAVPQGRLSKRKFKDWMIPVAGRLARQGNTDMMIAQALGVSIRLLRYWLAENEELRTAMTRDKGIADANVQMAMYDLAVGYDYYEEEVRVIAGEVVKIEVRKHKPGEFNAQVNWLANRTDWMRNPDTAELAAEAPVQEEIDITPDNARQMARKVALVLFMGGKVA